MVSRTFYEYRIPAVVLFILLKRYASVKRSRMKTVMEESNLPEKLMGLVNMALITTINNVRVKNETSKHFHIKVGPLKCFDE